MKEKKKEKTIKVNFLEAVIGTFELPENIAKLARDAQIDYIIKNDLHPFKIVKI